MVPTRQTLKKVPGIVPLYRLYMDLRLSYKRLIRNRVGYQRRHWAEQLAGENPENVSRLGYRWGDPECPGDRLGNYLHVLELLQKKINPSTCVLEIGSYGGKWTQYMKGAKKIICVDLFDQAFDFVRQRLGRGYPLEFYKTEGDELRGIASSSVDVVFCMDTLVRMPRRSICRYFAEIHRVLVAGGELMVHLPCKESALARGMYFTLLSRRWIEKMLEKSGFRHFEIDSGTLRHGVLVTASKDNHRK